MTPSGQAWASPPGDLRLFRDDVHVWAIPLNRSEAERSKLADRLSKDERSRAAAFHFERHRHRFTVGRGALREILGRYSGTRPERLEFEYGPRGKPDLSVGSGGAEIRFNLSHSHDLALCAVTLTREIGVDVERIRPDLDVVAIVDRFFSEAEKVAFRELPASRRREAFFRGWTRKESYQKSRGEGFFRSPAGFDVTMHPDEPPRLLQVRGEPLEARRWTLRDLSPAPGFVGSVIAEGHGWSLGCWQWDGSDA